MTHRDYVTGQLVGAQPRRGREASSCLLRLGRQSYRTSTYVRTLPPVFVAGSSLNGMLPHRSSAGSERISTPWSGEAFNVDAIRVFRHKLHAGEELRSFWT